MDSPLLILVIALCLGFFALFVESQGNSNHPPPPPPPPPPSPPPPSPPPPPPPSPPPPPPSPPPPLSQSPPPPPLSEWVPPPPPLLSPPPHPRPSPRPRRGLRPPPMNHNIHKSLSRKPRFNTGKKVGLMFIGVATILQVCVAAFLLIQRRQIFKSENV